MGAKQSVQVRTRVKRKANGTSKKVKVRKAKK